MSEATQTATAGAARSAGRAWAALARFAVVSAVTGKRSYLVCVLLCLPAVLGTIIAVSGGVETAEQNAAVYWGITLFVSLTTAVPLAAMLACSGLFHDEASDGTLVYLLTRRLGRARVFLAKLVGILAALCLVGGVAQLVFVAVIAAGRGLPADEKLPAVLGGCLLVALACVTFGAIFAAIGMIFRKPMAVAVSYMVIFEWFVASLPLDVCEISVSYQLRCLLYDLTESRAVTNLLNEVLPEEFATGASSAAVLAVTVAIAVAVAALLAAGREFTRAHEEGT